MAAILAFLGIAKRLGRAYKTHIEFATDASAFYYATLFSAVSFFFYAVSCLATERMRLEFRRYGLPRYRVLTGVSQLCASGGLMLGSHFPFVGALAAGGLAVQMVLALGVRLKIGDGVLQSLPAAVYGGLNTWLALGFLSQSQALQ